jgi:hypothetical protein
MKGLLYLFIAFVVSSPILHAQQTVTSATLSGRVEDRSGGTISGAAVSAANLETNQRLTTTTDQQGRFRFPLLRVGDYSLEIQAQGFEESKKNLTLSVGQTVRCSYQTRHSGSIRASKCEHRCAPH